MTSKEKVRIPFEQKELDGVFSVPDGFAKGPGLVLAHGAGGDLNLSQLENIARALARAGVLCLRFTCKAINLLYRIKAYGAVVDYLMTHKRFSPSSLFLGGRSLGARAAVAVCNQMCAEHQDVVRGLLCLSFPMYQPGKPQTYNERTEGLRALSQTPVLFVSGTADSMCKQKDLKTLMEAMESISAVHWVIGGTHGLAVHGRSEDSVLEEVNAHIISWVLQHK
ncbi:hypothetical protein DNTS_027191 [Danionella cerebrum]|uniref:KANL3/Tex30 alpha/beta hydrolase-like domain-containing protein n=1 Tax=Danionella cerebrum TaxID=2873325 RepID=A0A553QQ38_9TELE|nr:hypothetical protein DNTS_027191 [Danionella translucida]